MRKNRKRRNKGRNEVRRRLRGRVKEAQVVRRGDHHLKRRTQIPEVKLKVALKVKISDHHEGTLLPPEALPKAASRNPLPVDSTSAQDQNLDRFSTTCVMKTKKTIANSPDDLPYDPSPILLSISFTTIYKFHISYINSCYK